ncbi:MAG: ketoacyl-ACP synthase III [Bacteroidetes bacterium]|nr:ketoacyl-ACP synthase III [Bacteroidota bacterium]MBL0017105.1 ketoacyl-ACP synthase III [Bacteroidota bacterium]MBP6638752.1 ketoacyl-ACP synthase III [Bacteroidia bacterium]MBP6721126.1 ketoacyl-ACP synthase III [Bacteroidia bacterium]MBP8073545.1 ketoacyl-ACP synthase III [Bacteroidia bacterium]
MRTAAITALGHFLPEDRLTNADLEKMVDTNDAWIQERTGITERRILKNGATSDMAIAAVNELLERRGIKASEIDMLICATVTPDHTFPATANIITAAVGANNAWGFDLEAACSGLLYGLVIGSKFIETGTHKKVVVVGADKMSSIIDYTDRNTCVLFGDGCGALLLEPNEEGLGIIDSSLHSDGNGKKHLHMVAGGSRKPASIETVTNREHYVYQEGVYVFKFAVTKMADVVADVMARNHLTADDIAYLVPHQANKRIIDACAERMGVGSEKVMINIQRYGNTTGGTIPLCLWDWKDELKKGDNLILAAVGGGFTWGAIYLKWAI